MLKTKIEWCDSTWNPVTGCRHECPYCYARKQAQRFAGYDPIYSASMMQDSDGNYELGEKERKYKRTKGGKIIQAPYPFGFEPTLHRYRLDQPKKWVNPQTIFVCSTADLFGRWVPDSWINEVLEAAEKAQHHRYMFLTKNPMRYAIKPKDNWWFGTTVTDPEQIFFASPRHNTFLSIEPLQADFPDVPEGKVDGIAKVGWVIIGAESGNRKGRIIPKAEWVERITARCQRNSVPIFMKDSISPIIGEENMIREFPWEADG